MFEINAIRNDFPILSRKIYGKNLIYFDNAATTQKPECVINKVSEMYSSLNSNIHRAVHFLSDACTNEYEQAREVIRKYINAEKLSEIIFTKGTTESVNLVAHSFGEKFIQKGDIILATESEHHSNIVPWQLLCERKQAVLKMIPINEKGEIIFEQFENLLSEKVKLVAVAHVSNSLGTVNDIHRIIKKAHEFNAKVLIDGAQSVQHFDIDVKESDCDFFAFSGHKIYAETGIGVLYGKENILEQMPPFLGGGDMIKNVSFAKTEYADLPLKFEAGTPNYVGAVSIGEAIKYISKIGLDEIHRHENELLKYAEEKLAQIPNLKKYGTAEKKSGLISFRIGNIHHYDTGMILDKLGVAVRTGTHCAEPAMQHFGILGTVRASFAFYNTKEEIDELYNGLLKVQKMFA
jgi:cysteine desulfurase/selenocysteine lyase